MNKAQKLLGMTEQVAYSRQEMNSLRKLVFQIQQAANKDLGQHDHSGSFQDIYDEIWDETKAYKGLLSVPVGSPVHINAQDVREFADDLDGFDSIQRAFLNFADALKE